MHSSSKKALVNFTFEENALFSNLVDRANVTHQRMLIKILIRACLHPPESFADQLPIKDMVSNIHANSGDIISVPQAVQDMLILFGQMYREINESELPHHCDFKIVRFDERFVLIEYDIEDDPDVTTSLIYPRHGVV